MKKSFIILITLLSLSSYSQKTIRGKSVEINLLGLKVDFSAKYTKAEITHINGTKEIGYIYGFIQNKALSLNFSNPFSSSFSDALNLSDKSFSFKKELDQKLEEFASFSDNLDETFENREQIEISKFYERLPKPTLMAIEEFKDGKIYWRRPEIENQDQ